LAKANAVRARIKGKWADEFQDGARCAFLQKFEGEREKGGYPLGFHQWPPERRNSWFAGYTIADTTAIVLAVTPHCWAEPMC
jgi:hypothetical protein